MGKKRLRVEALLAAAALPLPSPALAAPAALPTDSAAPPTEDPFLLRLLASLPRADLYLQDEVQIALHPTLTRLWCRRGRRGQRRVQAPGKNAKQWGFGLVDWRDGWLDWAVAPGRWAAPLCDQLRRAVARSKARGRLALVVLDNLGIHTRRGSMLLRTLLDEEHEHLILVYTPPYDPDSNPIEWLWRILRPTVTHNHQRQLLDALVLDANTWATDLAPSDVLRHIGSPCQPVPPPPEELASAA